MKGEPAGHQERELLARLQADRVLLDPADPVVGDELRRDVARIAEEMERRDAPPPMLWTGIPLPVTRERLEAPFVLVVSVGGTKTSYGLLALRDGEVVLAGPGGEEVTGDRVGEVKASLRFPTPTSRDTPNGRSMLARIAEGMRPYLEAQGSRLRESGHILLSWGFAQDVIRTGATVLEGLTARTTFMTKEQAPFTADLAGQDLGALLKRAIEEVTGWSRPVTVANDGIMALHFFLTADRARTHARTGLFINGTGTNFATSEPFAVRAAGVVSARGERYEPERLTRFRRLQEGERREEFFVNYETGSIVLGATRTPYDKASEYSIEENALSGGHAFEHQLRELVRAHVGVEAYSRLCSALRARRAGGGAAPAGPEVSALADRGTAALEELFPGARLSGQEAARLILISRAIIARSALHAAIILAATTLRIGFGRGAGGLPDLLAMEGSVWRAPGYPELVRGYWQELAGGAPLHVDFDHEKSYDASLPGPVYLAALHGAPG